LNYGDNIKLVYKGYFLNGQIFDNYAAINPYFEHSVGTQNQLIQGMEMALKLMSYGTEAEFIFPSSLAFGKNGSSTGIVPAYKPLLYKVKILEKEDL
jgi:FKBP-type peptidyl-prolyl cis-trans isomerase